MDGTRYRPCGEAGQGQQEGLASGWGQHGGIFRSEVTPEGDSKDSRFGIGF